jgi:PPP family 3-phenylpropionic acid transporter
VTPDVQISDAPRPAIETIRRLNVAFVLVGVADATILPFIPLYLFERGFGASAIGILLAAAAMGSFVASPAWAYLADRGLRPERTLLVSGAAAAVASLVLTTANGILAVATATVVLWVARAPIISLLDAIALHRLGAAGRTGYARIRLRTSAGWAAAVIAAGALFQVAGLRLMPLLYAPLILLVGLWVWRTLDAGAPIALRPSASSPGSVSLPRIPVALIGFLVSALLVGLAFIATANFVTLRINGLGGGALLIGAAAAFQALTEIPTMAYTHVLTRRLSPRVLYVVGCVIYIAVFIAWAFVSDAFATALIKLVIGVGFALSYVATVLIADDLAPPHLRATAQALTKAVSGGLAPVVGALGGGLVYGAFGPRTMFLAAALVTAIAAVVILIALPRGAASREAAPPLRSDPPRTTSLPPG